MANCVATIFLYGNCGEAQEEEVLERGYQSESDDSEDGSGMEHAFQGGGGVFDDPESEEGTGNARGEGVGGLEYAFQDGIRGLFEGSDVDEYPDADAADFV